MSTRESREKKKLSNFYSRFYVYINQVFGDENIRSKILEIYKLNEKSLEVVEGKDRTGETWSHHVANIDNVQICSVIQGVQDINTEDTACQSYSLYNLLHKQFGLPQLISVKATKRFSEKREELVLKNTKNLVLLLFKLLENENIKIEINSLLFDRLKGNNGRYLVPGKGKYIDKIIPKIKKTLNEWIEYGYKYFL